MAKPRPAEAPNYSPPVYVPPPLDFLPAGVVAREPGVGEFPAPPVVKARRLTVVDGEGSHVTVFDPQLGGVIVVLESGRGPDPVWGGGCLGRFSPFGAHELRIDGDLPVPGAEPSAQIAQTEGSARRLVVVEGPERTERVIAIDVMAAPSLLVELVEPDPHEPWLTRTRGERFELGQVASIRLEDVE